MKAGQDGKITSIPGIVDMHRSGAGVRFAVLDSWRGICACLVAICHAAIYSHIYYAPLIRHALYFVDFFFVLSGFVLSYAYSHKLQNSRDGADFIVRRFGRLWPLHATTLFILVGFDLVRISVKIILGHSTDMFALARQPVLGTLSILAQLFLVNSVGVQKYFAGIFDWNYPSWSISVEFYVCIAFALVSVFAGRRKHWLLFGLLVFFAVADLSNRSADAAWAPFGRGFYCFLIGHFAYCACARVKLPKFAPTLVEAITLVGVLATVSIAILSSVTFFYLPILFGIAVFIFAQEAGQVSRLFKISIAQKLGDWSYSIYLVHVLVLQAFGVFARRDHIQIVMIKVPELALSGPVYVFSTPWYGDAALCFYMIAVIGVASLTYRYIEKPSRRLFYRLADSWRLKGALPMVQVTTTDAA
jgi:hypothetical protein